MDRNIKIAFVTHYKDLFGANKSLLNLVESLQQLAHIQAILIVPGEGKLTEQASIRNIAYKVIPFHYELNHNAHLKVGYRVFHLFKGALRFLCNKALVLKHYKYFRQFDIIHSNSSATLMGAYLSDKARKPHVWHIREFGFEDYKLSYNFGYSYFDYWLKKAAGVISISKSIYTKRVAAIMVTEKPVIYNGVVSQNEIQANKALFPLRISRKEAITFSIVGFISPEKNQMEAIKAFHLVSQSFDNTRLLIAGTGEAGYLDELKAYVDKFSLSSKVTFLGFRDQVNDVYKETDCLLMCSTNEAFGRVTVEAMSYGIPVLGFNNAGTAEIIKDSHNGFLYSHGAEELAEKMEEILTDAGLLQRLGNNCFKWVEDNYVTERCAQQVYHLYTRILKIK